MHFYLSIIVSLLIFQGVLSVPLPSELSSDYGDVKLGNGPGEGSKNPQIPPVICYHYTCQRRRQPPPGHGH
ncbi:hypothetical protein PGT21_013913 [Puccinia graminis f. sp. tritici]|uniref:Uncharacterized protein n=1 Tax=Puccinia graminis f. sp. tritici TaxID=56615 RepID=A0A5B0Q5K4_PUCGR|nr:hypothetical protein PGT21_013913 [Puccinia graminis f. sp. tritici]